MNSSQHTTFTLILVALAIIIMVRTQTFQLLKEIFTYHKMNYNWNPLQISIGNPLSGIFHSTMQPADSGGGSTSPTLWNVPIVDASGGSGTIQVVSTSAAGAYQNAFQGGNTPTGSAVSA